MTDFQSANLSVDTDVVHCGGTWTAATLGAVERRLQRLSLPQSGRVRFDLSALQSLDTAGAWLLQHTMDRMAAGGAEVATTGVPPRAAVLLELLRPYHRIEGQAPEPRKPLPLERLGRQTADRFGEAWGFLAFVGELTLALVPRLIAPWRLRWTALLHFVQTAGYDALPIVGLLSFLLGVVIAYQGGIQLQQYGASVYVADLVSLSVIRELAPLITAIIVAGRTGAAFTAQLGTMQVTEEIDALRVMGIDPVERLIIPRLLALVIAVPLLTVFAGITGLMGGIITAELLLGVGPGTFVEHMGRTVTPASYGIGVGKAPIFAAIIATVGCFRGLQVNGSAESVGRQTTISVVQSIFLVIVADAFFSVVFSKVGF